MEVSRAFPVSGLENTKEFLVITTEFYLTGDTTWRWWTKLIDVMTQSTVDFEKKSTKLGFSDTAFMISE